MRTTIPLYIIYASGELQVMLARKSVTNQTLRMKLSWSFYNGSLQDDLKMKMIKKMKTTLKLKTTPKAKTSSKNNTTSKIKATSKKMNILKMNMTSKIRMAPTPYAKEIYIFRKRRTTLKMMRTLKMKWFMTLNKWNQNSHPAIWFCLSWFWIKILLWNSCLPISILGFIFILRSSSFLRSACAHIKMTFSRQRHLDYSGMGWEIRDEVSLQKNIFSLIRFTTW